VIAGEDPVQVGEAGEFSGAGVSDFAFSDSGIVADQGASVGGAPDIELEAVTAMDQGKIEGLKRIFGDSPSGTGTAMAE
jgi:hypothetical protein